MDYRPGVQRQPPRLEWPRQMSVLLVAVVLVGSCTSSKSSAPSTTAKPAGPPVSSRTPVSTPSPKPGTSSRSKGAARNAEVMASGSGNVYGPTGPLVADLGFRPDVNGFGFENYGNPEGVTNLTPGDMQKLFGSAVCANTAGGTCDLIPPAKVWMDRGNQAMSGGHCYGLSVTALEAFRGVLQPDAFGAGKTPDLALAGNTDLQRMLALNFVTQDLPAIKSAEIHGTPNEMLDRLIQGYQNGANDPLLYGIGIYKMDPATGMLSGGHEVTPYAVEDQGGGKFAVLIYDNNYPKVVHAIIFDRSANTWTYTTTTVPGQPPDVYQGDATSKSLELDPFPASFGVQPCPFCQRDAGVASDGSFNAPSPSIAGSVRGGTAQANPGTTPESVEISLDGDPEGHAHLLITDQRGRHSGFFNGKLVNEIPGATSEVPKLDDSMEAAEPSYNVPDNITFTVTVDATGLARPDNESLYLTGPGYDTEIDNIDVSPGDKVTFAPSVDGSSIEYQAMGATTPELVLGAVDPGADYSLDLSGLDLPPGQKLDVSLGADHLSIQTPGAKGAASYSIDLVREDDTGQLEFRHDAVALNPGETHTLQFANWAGKVASFPLVVRANGSEQTMTLSNQAG